jgi:hypothetical protein
MDAERFFTDDERWEARDHLSIAPASSVTHDVHWVHNN